MTIRELKIADITIDDGILLRPLDEKLAKRYSEAMRHREPFPPIDVFFDDEIYRLADGRHRVRAALLAKRDTITADVEDGGFVEALKFAAGANETHGERRTNAIKRAYVRGLLLRDELVGCSNRELSRIARVSHQTVVNIRGKLEADGVIEPRPKRPKSRVSKIDTKPKINKKQRSKPKPKPRTQDQIHEEEAQTAIDLTRRWPHDGREGSKRWKNVASEHGRYMATWWTEFADDRAAKEQ